MIKAFRLIVVLASLILGYMLFSGLKPTADAPPCLTTLFAFSVSATMVYLFMQLKTSPGTVRQNPSAAALDTLIDGAVLLGSLALPLTLVFSLSLLGFGAWWWLVSAAIAGIAASIGLKSIGEKRQLNA